MDGYGVGQEKRKNNEGTHQTCSYADIIVAMRNYIVSCTTSDGSLQSRHVEARNHLAAVKKVKSEGLIVLSVDRDDGETRPRSHKRLKRLFISIIVCLIIATICVAVAWFRARFRI